MYFVEQSSFDALLSGIRAHHPDILVASDCFRLRNGAFNTVGDEGKRRRSLGHLFSSLSSKDKDRPGKGSAVWSHPPVRAIYHVERSSAHHHRPCRFEGVTKNLSGISDCATIPLKEPRHVIV